MKRFMKSAALALAALLATAPAWAQSSPNLGITHIQQNQAQKEVTTNQAFDALDRALTDTLDVDFTSGDVTLTDAQFRENIHFKATNLGAAQALTVPQIKRLFVVENPDATDTVTVTRGATTIGVGPGDTTILYTDGTANGLTAVSAALDFLGLSDTPGSYSGQALKAARVNAGETGLEFATISGGGGGGGAIGPWKFIETKVASASASIDFTDLTSDFAAYMILVTDLVPATDDTALLLRGSTDNGSTFLSTNEYDFVNIKHTAAGGEVASEFTGQAHVTLAANAGTGTNERLTAKIIIQNHAGTGYKLFRSWAELWNWTPEIHSSDSEGVLKTGTAVDALRLLMSSGNISSGTFHLFGLRAENPALPYRVDAWATAADTLTVSNTIHMAVANSNVTFEDDFAGCQGHAGTAPSGGAVSFDVQINGTSIGSVDFADASNTATCTTTGGTTEAWDTGQRLEIIAPANIHSMNGVAITLPGTTPAP